MFKKGLFLILICLLALIPFPIQAGDDSDGLQVSRSSTLVIAASDSSALSKAQADYVCDGTADDVEINQAIGNISVGQVILLEGNYNIVSSIVVKSNIVFTGQGTGTVIKGINFGLGTYADALIRSVYQADIINFTAKDFMLDGQRGSGVNTTSNGIRLGIGAQAKHCRIDRVFIKDIYAIGIAVSGVNSDDVCIDHCYINNTGKDCLYLNGHNHKITNNELTNSLDTAIALVYDGSVSPKDCIITGNHIYNNLNGIILDGVKGGTVSGNIIDTVTFGSGISVGGLPSSPRPTNITVTGNKVSRCQAIGIYLYKAKSCTIMGNTVFNNDQGNGMWGGITTYSNSADYTEYNTIVGNICYDDQVTRTQDYGYKEMGNSNHNVVCSNIFTNNVLAPLLIIGANDIVSNNMP